MKCVFNSTALAAILILIGLAQAARSAEPHSQDRQPPAAFTVPAFWEYSAPLIAPEKREPRSQPGTEGSHGRVSRREMASSS